MKYISMILALLVSATLFAQSASSDHIQIQLFGDETQTQAAVTLHDTLDADYVIVEFSYWQSLQMDYSTGKKFAPLLLHKVDVVPFYRDVPIGTVSVPVPRSAVKSVNVTVVKNIEVKKFEWTAFQGGSPQ